MENNSVGYSLPAQCHVKLPLTIEYDKLISLLCKKMSVRKRSVILKVTGRYLYSVTPQEFAFYSEINIDDDETLSDFLRTPDECREFLVITMLEMYVKVEDVPKNEVVRSRDNPQSSGGYSGAVFAGQVPDERVFLDLNLSPPANEQRENNLYPDFHNSQDEWGYRPDINFTSGPSGSHHLIKNVHHGISSHYDFENEQVEPPVLTQWTENDILHQDLADAQSEEQNSDYDNNADESVDETPFFREDGDEQDEKEGPDLKRDPPRRRVYKSKVLFHSREIPYIDNLPTMSDVEALTRDFDKIRTAMWDESRPTVLAKGMLFLDKVRLSKAYKMHNVKECREMQVWESSPMVYKVVCRRWFWPCNWMLRATKKKTGIWKMGKYIPTHTCEMYTFNGNHFNLDIDLISLILIPHLEASIRYTIKECITSVHQEYGHTITKRKAFLRRKRAFEIVYGNWDKSFASLPKYMAAMQHFNPGTVVEWKLEQSPGTLGYIFNYVFWAFKPAIYDFSHCRPVISIDGTHIYGKYDIKLLIAVAVDANGQIFPLAFAVCANESTKTWTLFLNHLKEHVVKQRLGICLIFDRHGGILSSVENLPAWQEPYAYHCYCVRHFKANFQKAHPNKDLHDLMWMAATDHQQHKFRRHMDSIRQEDQVAYRWLMRHDPEKWTLHADGGRRWGILTTNMSESFNGLLK
ncbi:uncharacterized protein LOC107782834 isoform X5 [Nicotiana tabacum]|uniref:Uncharacterized protein LOC107782834 isoform X5 n=1 Tax=Nicotiana tabacum TaxID=4097 RepID=A0AC58RSL4_TOBAC